MNKCEIFQKLDHDAKILNNDRLPIEWYIEADRKVDKHISSCRECLIYLGSISGDNFLSLLDKNKSDN